MAAAALETLASWTTCSIRRSTSKVRDTQHYLPCGRLSSTVMCTGRRSCDESPSRRHLSPVLSACCQTRASPDYAHHNARRRCGRDRLNASSRPRCFTAVYKRITRAAAERVDEIGGGEVAHCESGVDGGMAEPDENVALACIWGSDDRQIVLGANLFQKQR